MWRLLFLLVFAAYDGPAASAQLLGPEECGIGYQYRSPPEMLNCRANITVTRLNCWVAIPNVTPPGARANVVWYWRSLDEAERGSNTAFEVADSPPFKYVNTICDREPICPTDLENLTVNVSYLEISHFEAPLQGDYACRLVLINQTTGMVQQALQPSACARLQFFPGQVVNCDIYGQRSTWTCADTIQQLGQCPQEFLFHPTTSIVTHTISTTSPDQFKSPSYALFHITSQSTAFFASTTGSPTVEPSPHTPHSTTYTQPSPSPPHSTTVPQPSPSTPTEEQSNTLNYVYVLPGLAGLLILAAIATSVLIILGIRSKREKRVISLKNVKYRGRTPTYVIAPGIHHGKDDSLNKSGTALRRNSTIYSKPTWPGHTNETDPREHHYAVIAGEQECNEYSYAYQHDALPALMKQAEEGSGNTNGTYQKIGTPDYIQMYSKPSTFPLSSEQGASPPAFKEERAYAKLSSATLNESSVYTKPTNVDNDQDQW